MSLWSRIGNAFRGDRLSREIDEEMQSHLEEAVRQGRDPDEARRAFGSFLRRQEDSRDLKVVAWLDSLRADAIFGVRRLKKNKVTSAAAILSLALAIGACTSAFRLMDALLFRPLPMAHPERLYAVAFQGSGVDGLNATYDSSSYPMFTQMRAAVKEQADLVAVSYADRLDLTFGATKGASLEGAGSDLEMEKAYTQYVSGWMFQSFGLQPALGRVLTAEDDAAPGAHPVAVISYDYWTRRFGRDPQAVGRAFHIGDTVFQIIGVAPEGFSGTETGLMTDVFLPMAMKNPKTLASPVNFWLRTLLLLHPGVSIEPVYAKLNMAYRALQVEQSKAIAYNAKHLAQAFPERLLLEASPSGRSNLQRDYRRALIALGVLVAMVLLIACANVANLMTAQAAGRTREMALRVSIGAGRRRLLQLVLVESAVLTLLAAAIGGLFAWWSAPFVVNMINPPYDPARLDLPADWRVLGFGLAVTLFVTFLFGLAPALGASAVKPASALKGGDDPHSKRRLMHALIGLQVAFCFLVLFVAGLFVATFDRLSHQPTGFSAERILNLESVAAHPVPPVAWDQTAEHLRTLPGVEKVALVGWPLMSGESRVTFVVVNGEASTVLADLLQVSPGWMDTMRIPFIAGRDFLPSETFPNAAIVNETFAKQYFDGVNPTGRTFTDDSGKVQFQIVGLVHDARLRDDMRRPIRPTVFAPFRSVDAQGAFLPIRRGTFVVRTSSTHPLALAATFRQEVPRAQGGLRVSNIRTQLEINQIKTVRERLLATLALFFAGVALLLAGVGLYGVLDYSVLQRRREIGIRVAIGARPAGIVRLVTNRIALVITAGAVAGVVIGMASVRYIEGLLFQVHPTDLPMLAVPALTMLVAAVIAASPAVLHAVQIDPVEMLRSE
jgi:predicted permease